MNPTSGLLPHLSGPGAGLRQAMAAQLVRGIPHLVEIGGAGAPISDYLLHRPESVTVYDPKIAPLTVDSWNGFPCRVRHVAAKFQAGIERPAGAYAVIFVGLSLKPFGSREVAAPALLALLRDAEVVVIEHAQGLARATSAIPGLIAGAELVPFVSMDYVLHDGALDSAGFAERRLLACRSRR